MCEKMIRTTRDRISSADRACTEAGIPTTSRAWTSGSDWTPVRHGFTLIEVLAVIAIIGVLVGLLLPAVQSTRERARATSCKNNLLQVHLAVEAYHSAFAVFPAGTVTDRLPARMFPDGKDHSWLVQIRPFMEGGFAFSERWSSVHSAYHPRNWSLVKMMPPFAACPSSPFMHAAPSNVTPLSYVGIHDGTTAPIDTKSRGFFAANRFLDREDISDGLSYTLQLGEIRVDLGETFFWIAGNQSTLRTTGLPIEKKSRRWSQSERRTQFPYGRFADPPVISYAMVAEQIAKSRYDYDEVDSAISDLAMQIAEQDELGGIDSMGMVEFGDELSESEGYDGTVGFNVPHFTIGKLEPAASQPLKLGSSHGAMFHGAFADGRVVTINQSIDARLFSQIGIRDDALPLVNSLMETE